MFTASPPRAVSFYWVCMRRSWQRKAREFSIEGIDQRRQITPHGIEHDRVFDPIVAVDDAVSQADGEGQASYGCTQGRCFIEGTARRLAEDFELPLYG